MPGRQPFGLFTPAAITVWFSATFRALSFKPSSTDSLQQVQDGAIFCHKYGKQQAGGYAVANQGRCRRQPAVRTLQGSKPTHPPRCQHGLALWPHPRELRVSCGPAAATLRPPAARCSRPRQPTTITHNTMFAACAADDVIKISAQSAARGLSAIPFRQLLAGCFKATAAAPRLIGQSDQER